MLHKWYSVCFKKDFIAKNAEKELQRLPTIVAMDTMRRNSSSPSIVSYLVIASESGEVIILDTQSFSVLHHASILFSSLIFSAKIKLEKWNINYSYIIRHEYRHLQQHQV